MNKVKPVRSIKTRKYVRKVTHRGRKDVSMESAVFSTILGAFIGLGLGLLIIKLLGVL